MASVEPMVCEGCGVAMNLHAEKMNYEAEAEGVLEEIHACPSCGATGSRPSADPLPGA
jgi:hypothetical protein